MWVYINMSTRLNTALSVLVNYYQTSKHGLRGLFVSARINGTTWYDEAAVQSIIAGINTYLPASSSHTSSTHKRDKEMSAPVIHGSKESDTPASK